MLFAIYAGSNYFNVLHDEAVVECCSKNEAIEIAADMSYDVITSYLYIMDSIYEEAAAEFDMSYDEMLEKMESNNLPDNFFEVVDDIICENMMYEITELDENCGATLDYLNSLTYDEVVNSFGKEE